MRDVGWPPRQRRPSKYEPLADALHAQHGHHAHFTFAAIEALLGDALPPMVRRRRWWTNQRSIGPHVRAWLDAGWRVAAVDLAARTVTFERQHQPPAGDCNNW